MTKREIINGVSFRSATPQELAAIKRYLNKWHKQMRYTDLRKKGQK